jgi:hypothetical protein
VQTKATSVSTSNSSPPPSPYLLKAKRSRALLFSRNLEVYTYTEDWVHYKAFLFWSMTPITPDVRIHRKSVNFNVRSNRDHGRRTFMTTAHLPYPRVIDDYVNCFPHYSHEKFSLLSYIKSIPAPTTTFPPHIMQLYPRIYMSRALYSVLHRLVEHEYRTEILNQGAGQWHIRSAGILTLQNSTIPVHTLPSIHLSIQDKSLHPSTPQREALRSRFIPFGGT